MSRTSHRVFKGKSDLEVAAAFGSPALSDASSDEQIARAISISRKSHRALSEYDDDEQSLLSDKTRYPAVSRAYSYASSRDSTLLGSSSGSGSSTPRSHYAMSPTPTPRYAADEIIARNLARSLHVASIQGDLIDDPGYVRTPPLVVRVPSPTASIRSERTMYQSPSGPLSPLLLPTRYLDTASLRSMESMSSLRSSSSTRSSASMRSVSSISTVSSITSLLSNVTRSSRHEPLDSAARALRASLPRSPSSVSTKSSLSRASTKRSSSTLSARGIPAPETHALEKLRALAISPVRCTRPGCGTLIPPAPLDNIGFPIVFRADASPPRELFNALHACCPACAQNHCRACGLPTGCAVGCVGDSGWTVSGALVPNNGNTVYPPPPCPVPTHCAAARALGVLAALIAFDRAHIAMGVKDQGRAADRPLIGALQTLVFFLSPATPGLPSESSPLLSASVTEAPLADPALAPLIGLSRVPAYAASLLRAGAGVGSGGPDVGTWMARAPAYTAVLRLLRAFGDAGCTSVLGRPVRVGAGSGAGVGVWFRRGPSPPSPSPSREGREDGETLRTLIRNLEASRAALLRLAGVTTFRPTVEKAHALCDGILYLLLQDVLGEEEEE
ncbi:hypothetical protein FB45DRAFT_997828 [Roridomyces roridus]|uniref:Uncharacterized protein n=1 Tax=Roridomyces roridus TaxID=1738132 RepID=A0AAD7G2V9_9AGAR|nr:hypothetical protein FB45DRAFT_997828 [Roridomyces roridus]